MKYNELKAGMVFQFNITRTYMPEYLVIIISDRLYVYGFYNNRITIDFIDKKTWIDIAFDGDYEGELKLIKVNEQLSKSLIKKIFELKYEVGIK